MNQRLQQFIVLVGAAILLFAPPLYAEPGGHGHDPGHGGHGHAADAAPDPFNMAIKKRRSRPLSFDKYKKYLKGVCVAVEQDGRREQVYEILKANTDKVPECPGCRPLIKAFASACKSSSIKRKPKKKKKKLDEDDEDAEEGEVAKEDDDEIIHKQREPNIQAIDSLALSFDRIAQDEKRREDALPAVERLATIFRQREGRTRAQFEYLDIMAEHMMAPFAELIEKQARMQKVVAESDKDAHIDPFMKNLTAEEEEELYDF